MHSQVRFAEAFATANHRVQVRAISSAGDNADALAHTIILLSVRPTKSRGFRE
jgi:hypothetical protein